MNQPTEKRQISESGVDISNIQKIFKQDERTTGNETKPRNSLTEGSAGLSNFTSKLNPIHYGAAVATLAAVWIGWPYIFSDLQLSDQPENSSHMLVPTQAMTMQQHNLRSASQAETTPETEVASANRIPESEVIAEPASMVINSSITAQPSVTKTEPQPKVNKRRRKLPEAQTAQCSGLTNDRAGSSRDFSLNTIYRDQAWIQNVERTYVVQAGDVINGLCIVRIEPDARRVITSLGIIQ